MTSTLNGQVCLVTGASSGIGAAIVDRLTVRGATVHAVARDRARLAEVAARTGAIGHALDVTDLTGLTDLVERIRPDVVVCNAGVNAPGSLAGAHAEDVDRIIDVDLRSVLHLVRLALPAMQERGRGHVVLISSIAGRHPLGNGNAIYHAAKHGVRALAEQLRLDLLGYRIRVTEIAPGRTRTELFGKVLGDADLGRERFLDGYEPLEAQDVADAVMFALTAPAHVNIGHIEMTPTLQAIGGLTTLPTSQVKGTRTP
mgnify:CR=1 FL=1